MTTNAAAQAKSLGSLVSPATTVNASAVTYLRVSTKEQAERDGQEEGFSIPAQREANQRKAEQIGASIVEEFVDAGESARKADRPQLMQMIKYVTEHRINYCIVHKVDRLARNRADDVTIHLALREAGVTLVSASENIDETPSGMLLHGIMSTIAEFYSQNLATETVKGLAQKASRGGTIGRAPIGYLNVAVRDERGREVRTVEIDTERARLIEWAYKAFASGDWSLSQMERELKLRGLTTVPTPRRPSRPVGQTTLHRILTNPYYKGDIRYRGATYKGTHEPLVPTEVWHQVQVVLDTHKSAADAHQSHDHYLKGTVFCGQCGERLIITNARSSTGKISPYFLCAGRQAKRTNCTRQAMLISDVERLVEEFYQHIHIPAELRQRISEMFHAEFDRLLAADTEELDNLVKARKRFEDEQTKLIQAHYADAVPLDLLKREQTRLSTAIEEITNRLEAHHDDYLEARHHVEDSLNLLQNCAQMYTRADDANRRLCNQALFRAIYVEEDNEVRAEHMNPFDVFCDAEVQADALTWAHKKAEAQTATTGQIVESLNLGRLG